MSRTDFEIAIINQIMISYEYSPKMFQTSLSRFFEFSQIFEVIKIHWQLGEFAWKVTVCVTHFRHLTSFDVVHSSYHGNALYVPAHPLAFSINEGSSLVYFLVISPK